VPRCLPLVPRTRCVCCNAQLQRVLALVHPPPATTLCILCISSSFSLTCAALELARASDLCCDPALLALALCELGMLALLALCF
jgi:hypothetical protein